MESRSKYLLYFGLMLCLIASSSCATYQYPLIAELEPIPLYGPERTDWDTSAKCIVIHGRSYSASLKLARILEDRGYTIVPEETGYLTRAQRRSVDKIISVGTGSSKYISGSDGTCTEAEVIVTVYDIEQDEDVATTSARSQVIGEIKEPAKHDQALDQALENLFRIESFRNALSG